MTFEELHQKGYKDLYVTATCLNRQKLLILSYETLGIRIDSDLQIREDSLGRKLAPYPIEDFTDYISAFYIMVIENLNRNTLTEDDWNRTISVSSVGITPKIKQLTTQQKEMLIKSGKESTDSYLQFNR